MGTLVRAFLYRKQAKIKINMMEHAFANLGPHPTRIECTNCQSQVTTNTKSSPGIKSWITGIVLCVFGCWPCACIPCCCCPEWNDVTHFCPQCNNVLGKYR